MLSISRWSTAGVLLICMGLAWMLVDRNIALIIMIGSGGMISAFAGPLVMGALWKGVTKAGAYAGLASGMGAFLVLHAGLLHPDLVAGTWLFGPVAWLHGEAPNPYSCAALGELVSVLVTWSVSKLTRPLPKEHLDEMFSAADHAES